MKRLQWPRCVPVRKSETVCDLHRTIAHSFIHSFIHPPLSFLSLSPLHLSTYNVSTPHLTFPCKLFYFPYLTLTLKVYRFYEYWINFESWRDFTGVGAEHKIDDAMSRDEKRYYAKVERATNSFLFSFFALFTSGLVSVSVSLCPFSSTNLSVSF